jgi:hypothetical protein
MNEIGWLLLTIMLAILWACSPTMDPQADHAKQSSEDSMNLAHQFQSESRAIPPIDAAVPAVFETASFGLG